MQILIQGSSGLLSVAYAPWRRLLDGEPVWRSGEKRRSSARFAINGCDESRTCNMSVWI
ncbi:MAG: hypothetical protein OXC62_09030 [Aestuariivita sp.]|nr:hypothetical protein [Aestuariivita sp.]